jgi:hypothetical protein
MPDILREIVEIVGEPAMVIATERYLPELEASAAARQ